MLGVAGILGQEVLNPEQWWYTAGMPENLPSFDNNKTNLGECHPRPAPVWCMPQAASLLPKLRLAHGMHVHVGWSAMAVGVLSAAAGQGLPACTAEDAAQSEGT